MTDYVVRVELHNEQKGDYPLLHAQMTVRGFTRTIMAGNINYHLPNATYLKTTNETSEQVYNAAQAAVAAIGRKGGVVTAASSFANMWVGGLIPV